MRGMERLKNKPLFFVYVLCQGKEILRKEF